MDVQEIKSLIEMFEKSSLSELVLEKGGERLILRREPGGGVKASASSISAPASEQEQEKEKEKDTAHVIRSPLVGTFYRRPAPEEDPFVEVGDRVEKGDTICIVEAMKVMNEIAAERAGIVEKILAEDGHSVEYGQPLIVLQPL